MKRKLIFFIILIISIKYIFSLDYTIPPNTYSIQSGDFDNDGDNDIVVGHINNDTYLSIIRNNGNGEFETNECLTSSEVRMFYMFSNFDENPIFDFVIQNEYFNLIIYYNSDFDNPYYYNLQSEHGFNKIHYGDFDGDEVLDLVFSSSGAGLDNLWGLMYNLGDREFSEPEWFECPSQALNADFEKFECNDLDNNGFDDIIAFSFADTYIYYFSEDGFTVDSLDYQVTSSGMTYADFDNDEDYDIVIVHWPIMTQDNFKIYENLGNQNFTLHNYYCETLWGNPISCEINNDNLIDIVTVGDEIKKYFNEGNLQFSEVYIQDYPDYGESWVESSFSDFDGNGTQDVAIIRYGIEENNLTILYNDGDGNFLEEPQVSVENCELEIANYELTNYPNPFNSTTTISYQLNSEQNEQVSLEIYNIRGQKVFSKMNLPSEGFVSWNCENQTSGIYLIKISNSKQKYVKKITYIK